MAQGDDYAASHDSRSRRYNDEYKKWFASLPETERAKLTELGLHRPDDGRHIATPGDLDVTEMQLGDDADGGESHRAGFDFDEPVAHDEVFPEEVAPSEEPKHADRWREVVELLLILLEANDTRYVANLVALAAGCEGMIDRCTEREISTHFRVARSHVRGAVGAIRHRMGGVSAGGSPDWDFVARMVTLVITQPEARLSVECFCLSADLGSLLVRSGDSPPSQADIARKHRCTRAAVSKRVKTFSERLMLRPCGSMRKLELCEKYRAARHRVVARERAGILVTESTN